MGSRTSDYLPVCVRWSKCCLQWPHALCQMCICAPRHGHTSREWSALLWAANSRSNTSAHTRPAHSKSMHRQIFRTLHSLHQVGFRTDEFCGIVVAKNEEDDQNLCRPKLKRDPPPLPSPPPAPSPYHWLFILWFKSMNNFIMTLDTHIYYFITFKLNFMCASAGEQLADTNKSSILCTCRERFFLVCQWPRDKLP